MPPFISILVPTKNVAQYIDSVINSLFNLNYPKDFLEIIILDGHSTDGTRDIVKKYPVILYEGDWNVPAFYNRVLKKCRGEIIAFGDGDAIVDKDWLNVLIAHFENPQVAGAGGLCLTANPEKLVPRVIGYELKARYIRMPQTITRIATMNVLYRKSILLDIGGFDERFDTGYDAEIGHRICRAGYIVHFDPNAVVYHYNRSTIVSYFRQQLIYGKNVTKMYLVNAHIATGDEITSIWMNIQPLIYTIIALNFIISPLFPVGFMIGLFLIFGLLVTYSVSATRLYLAEKDISAFFFVVLCFVRATAWTTGGALFVISSIWTRGRR